MKSIYLVLALASSLCSFGQKKNTVGFELDALPYITGGYYGSAWLGHNHMRYRLVAAKINTPDFFVADGFTGNSINAYAGIVDYFFKSEFKGLWAGAGLEYWDCKIQADAKLSTASYNNTVFTVGGGYVWKFYKNFYLNPWVAFHGRVGGDKKVPVDGEIFSPPVFTPEASLKIGWHF